MIEIVDALSADIVAGLAAAGYPPLRPFLDEEPGKIILGDKYQFNQYLPPRILMIPTKAVFGAKDLAGGVANRAGNLTTYAAERKAQVAQRAIMSEEIAFEVGCWGIAPESYDNDPVTASAIDFQFTRALYLQFFAACQQRLAGIFSIEGGIWRAVQHTPRVGREFIFSLTVGLPVLAELAPSNLPGHTGAAGLPFAPPGVVPVIEDAMVLPDGTEGPGCEEP